MGCGEYPGQDFVVESLIADGAYGAELLAHELAHNLGLGHRTGNNLMNPELNHQTALNLDEVSTIFSSPLVKNNGATDNSNRIYWIDINPVLIVAQLTQVPEPSALLLMLFGLGYIRYVSVYKNNKN